MKKKCNDCGKEVPEDSVFCQYCGSKNIVVIPEKQEKQRSFKKCMDCGEELPDDSKFCQYCGSSRIITESLGQGRCPWGGCGTCGRHSGPSWLAWGQDSRRYREDGFLKMVIGPGRSGPQGLLLPPLLSSLGTIPTEAPPSRDGRSVR